MPEPRLAAVTVPLFVTVAPLFIVMLLNIVVPDTACVVPLNVTVPLLAVNVSEFDQLSPTVMP